LTVTQLLGVVRNDQPSLRNALQSAWSTGEAVTEVEPGTHEGLIRVLSEGASVAVEAFATAIIKEFYGVTTDVVIIDSNLRGP